MAWRQGPNGQTHRAARPGTPPGPIVQQSVMRVGLRRDEKAAQPRAEASPPKAWCAEVFRMIEWRRFESVVEALFAQAGFETRTQPCGADGGVDIWLHSQTQAGAAVSLVQCKQWALWKVGVKPIRELRGVMAAHSIARGQFVSTSGYTSEAKTFAQQNGIMLHDTLSLLTLIASRTPEQQRQLLDLAFAGDYSRPTCASCGIKLVERTARVSGERFWGCANYPRCRTKMQMKR